MREFVLDFGGINRKYKIVGDVINYHNERILVLNCIHFINMNTMSPLCSYGNYYELECKTIKWAMTTLNERLETSAKLFDRIELNLYA